MTDARVVLMTAPDRASADALAGALVDERLAACVSVLPGLVSVYRWEGATQRSEELLLLAKTRADRVPALIARATELHPYEVPELLALPVEDGLGRYLDWVGRESAPERP